MTQLPRFSSGLALVFALAGASMAQDWPHWRGPEFNGSQEAKGLPTEFGPEKNVRWKVDLPGPGASTPIVFGDRVFLSSVDRKRDRLVAICVDRKQGKVLWTKDAGSGYQPVGGGRRRTAKGNRSNYASPSPVTDGKRVVFFFGNGDLVAYDYAGEELWRRNIQKDYGNFAFLWTFSAGPTMWEGKVFLPVLQRDRPVSRGGMRRRGPRRRQGGGGAGQAAGRNEFDSFVLAVSPETGKTIYRQVRPSPARMESRESYATAIPCIGDGGRKELLVVGGDVITGHDPATGSELWRWGTWNDGHRQQSWRLVPSVVHGGGVVLACAPKGSPVYAVRLGGKGELGDDGVVWKSGGRRNPVSSDVPTPAFAGGYFYVLSDIASSLSKVAAKDGDIVWTTPLSRDYKWRASPTVADGKVWCLNHNGMVTIVDAESGKIVNDVNLGSDDDDSIRSSIAVAYDSLFVRTNDRLYCIGK